MVAVPPPNLIFVSTSIMDSLPLELFRHHIVADYHICGTLRRTCKRYARITFVAHVAIMDCKNHEINETGTHNCYGVYLSCGGKKVLCGERPRMYVYLQLCDYTGADYALWLCSLDSKKVAHDVAKITANYTCRIIIDNFVAIYIKTSELLERLYEPIADDVLRR